MGRERVAFLCSCQATHCLRQSEIISQPYSSPAFLMRKLGSSQISNKCCSCVSHMDVTLAVQAWTCCRWAVQVEWSSPFLLWILFYFSSLCSGLLLNEHHGSWLKLWQLQWLSLKLVAPWIAEKHIEEVLHQNFLWFTGRAAGNNTLLLKPFYYRKSLWPFILRISHISVVCRRCLVFSRGNPFGPQKSLLFVP